MFEFFVAMASTLGACLFAYRAARLAKLRWDHTNLYIERKPRQRRHRRQRRRRHPMTIPERLEMYDRIDAKQREAGIEPWEWIQWWDDPPEEEIERSPSKATRGRSFEEDSRRMRALAAEKDAAMKQNWDYYSNQCVCGGCDPHKVKIRGGNIVALPAEFACAKCGAWHRAGCSRYEDGCIKNLCAYCHQQVHPSDGIKRNAMWCGAEEWYDSDGEQGRYRDGQRTYTKIIVEDARIPWSGGYISDDSMPSASLHYFAVDLPREMTRDEAAAWRHKFNAYLWRVDENVSAIEAAQQMNYLGARQEGLDRRVAARRMLEPGYTSNQLADLELKLKAIEHGLMRKYGIEMHSWGLMTTDQLRRMVTSA